MTEPTKEQVKAFLKDLRDISNMHEITIHSCGCCGSPWLDHTDSVVKKYHVTDDLEYLTARYFKDEV